MNIQRLRAIYRVGFGLLTLAALAVQYFTSRTLPTFSPVNYFSYMTNLSNLLGAIVFLWFGLSTRRTLGLELLRGAAILYLTLVFVVYVLLLSDIPLGILRPWVNVVFSLHHAARRTFRLGFLTAAAPARSAFDAHMAWVAARVRHLQPDSGSKYRLVSIPVP